MGFTKVCYRKDGLHFGGLFVIEPIKKGEVVAMFDGNYYEWGETTLNLPNDPPIYLRDHAIQYGPGISRDSGEGLGRWANHSCSPNCGIQNYFEIVAMRDLEIGEEITWDYAMTECNDWVMTCRCGSKRCRKLITGYKNLPPLFRNEYGDFVSQWLRDADIPFEGEAEKPEMSEICLNIAVPPLPPNPIIRAIAS